MPKKTSVKEAEKWLLENSPNLKLLEWGGKASADSVFFDKTRNKEFVYKFSVLKFEMERSGGSLVPRASLEEIKEKSKNTNLKKYGVDHYSKTKEYKKRVKISLPSKERMLEKRRATSLKKYGVDHPAKNEKIKEKMRQTNLSRYGTEYSSQNESVKKKAIETNLKKYGVKYPWQDKEIFEKAKITFNQKYGCNSPLQHPGIKSKLEKTNKLKYGAKSPVESNQIKEKIKETINSKSKKIGRLSVVDFAKSKDISYTTALRLQGSFNEKDLDDYNKKVTDIELLIKLFLDKFSVKYNHNKQIKKTSLRPDFIVPSHNLVIECDGLYWHSDRSINFKEKLYHKKKLDLYNQEGYRALFFREDEIKNKTKICESIILNHLGKNVRIFARQCDTKTTSSCDFIARNHLMGKGSGRIYTLSYKKIAVAAIQVKWRSKKEKILEISRFCTKSKHSVVGGFSKLLKEAIKKESPKKIITFVDKRYGSGYYLSDLGFNLANENLSFRWTDFKNTFHRMKFPGNSGYDYGLAKIWDCGQAKWELSL